MSMSAKTLNKKIIKSLPCRRSEAYGILTVGYSKNRYLKVFSQLFENSSASLIQGKKVLITIINVFKRYLKSFEIIEKIFSNFIPKPEIFKIASARYSLS